jgi:8-oxo-dGTP diphosphatase
VRDMADFDRDEIHHRRFYHLRCTGNPPETWEHGEFHPSDGTPGPIVFAFFWAPLLDGVPSLIADHGVMLPQLIEMLSVEKS